MMSVVAVLVSLPLVLYLPGAITWAAFGRARWKPSPAELGFVQLALSALLSGWVALLLAELGHFSLALLLALLLAYCLLVYVWRRPRLWNASPAGHFDVALVVLAVLAALLFARPHEFILGGADAGVYVNVGAAIAERGSILLSEPPLPAEARPELLRMLSVQSSERRSGVSTAFRFAGIYIDGRDPSQLIPSFFHLYPVWIGLFDAIGGVWLGLFVAPLFGLLGCLACALLGRSLFGGRAGLVAALFLALTPLQIWFSREPLSETLTQFCVMTGVFGLVRFSGYRSTDQGNEIGVGDPRYALLAGLALGEAFLARIDTLLLLAVLLAYLVLLRVARRLTWSYLWFLAPFSLLLVHSALHASLISWPYTVGTYSSFWSHPPLFGRLGIDTPTALVLGVTGVGAFLAADAVVPRDRLLTVDWLRGWQGLRLPLSVVLVLAVAYAYFIRPVVTPIRMVYYDHSGDYIPVLNHETLVRLGWYISPLGIALAVAGALLVLYHRPSPRAFLLLLLGGGYTALFTYDIMNNPHQIYAMRRFVPVALPALAIFISIAVWHIWDLRKRLSPAGPAFALILAILFPSLLWADRVVVPHQEYRGAIAQVSALAEMFPPRSVLLFDDRGVGEALGLPLTLVFARQSYTLQRPRPDAAVLERMLQQWQADDRPVYLVTTGAERILPSSFSLVPFASFTLDLPVLEHTYEHFPEKVERLAWQIDAYRLSPPGSAVAPVPSGNRFDIGALDLETAQDGFWGHEVLPDHTTYRWTKGSATISLPSRQGHSLALRLGRARPAGVSPALVAVFLGQKQIGSLTVDGDFRVYEIPLPDSGTGGENLRLQTDTFRPVDYGLSDSRELGVQVDWVEVR